MAERVDRDQWPAAGCSVAAALEVVGTRSALLMLREAFYGTRRFDDFARRVGVSDAAASARLRVLVDDGLLERRPYRESGQRTRLEYRLTQKGRDLFVALVALMDWGDRYLAPTAGPAVLLSHRDCGTPVHATVVCAAGHEVTARDTQADPGPGSGVG